MERPKFKKRCSKCHKYTFTKHTWSYCLACREKAYGRYNGPDRQLYV
jgi:hypothetical protein